MFEIDNLSIEDIEDVLVIENKSFSIPWSKQAFIDEINNSLAFYLVVKEFGICVGYIGLWQIGDEAHITNIAVHPDYRRRKIGSLLMDQMFKSMTEKKVTSFTLEVRQSNNPAIEFYKKYGFQIEGLRKAYYADNKENAYIMWKRIPD